MLCLYTLLCARAEAAGGEYLHKYWTKTGRNSRTATGLILDKYFTRPTNTPGVEGRGVRGVENEEELGVGGDGGIKQKLIMYIFALFMFSLDASANVSKDIKSSKC